MTHLSVVLSQYEPAGRHPQALRRLIAVLDRLREVALKLVLVDNAHPGDWRHQVSGDVLQIGGDNSAREFSAFDKGIATCESWRSHTDIYVLVTDAFQAYGEEYLELIDDQVVRCASRLPAAIGWVDSFPEECRIGDLSYDAYLRSSFLFLPRAVLAAVQPLAADLETMRVFGTGADQPFAQSGTLSANLQELLVEWLTTTTVAAPRLSERWHSAFELTSDTYPLFRHKASAILREHLIAAKLKAAGVAAYDFRVIRYLQNCGSLDDFLTRGGNESWQWLGFRTLLHHGRDHTVGTELSPGAAAAGAPAPVPAAAALLLAGELGRSQTGEAARFAANRVLPLVRQRHGSARLIVVSAGDHGSALDADGSVQLLLNRDEMHASGLLDGCAAIIVPPGSNPECLGFLDGLAASGIPVVASSAGPVVPAEREWLPAESAVDFASACCLLIDRRAGRADRKAEAPIEGGDPGQPSKAGERADNRA